MPVTANETAFVGFGMDARTTLQTPLPPAVVVHVALGPVPFQVPCTVAPVTRLCRQSWTVICTEAVHVLPLLAATPLRLPTWRLGAVTVIAIDAALLLGLLSASFCVAVRMWPAIVAPPVPQLKVRVALAPAASPVIVCVPITALPAVASVSTTSKLLVTSDPPTFWTVTTTGAVSPCVTWEGAVILARARSVGVGVTETVTELWLFAALSSLKL